MNHKSKAMTIREAAKIAFDSMSDEFNLIDLIPKAREVRGTPYLTDGSITRELRYLRSDCEINYEVIDRHKARYKKLEINPQRELF